MVTSDPHIQNDVRAQAKKRRTFAIISHPDAGKTTVTEKLLLYSGMVRTAGMVGSRKSAKTATSDWMEMEQERGISITASAMQFQYKQTVINVLDTPGHQDFCEDTYRTLTAADSAVMVIDAAKGVETQTRKLFEVCRLRKIPVLTLINKMDLPGRPPLDLSGWFDNCEVGAPGETENRAQYMQRLCRGGFPEAVGLTQQQRRGWYDSYLETVIQRDVIDLGDIRRAEALVDLVRWLAANTATELNVQAACGQLGIDRSTFNHYFAWLRTVFMINPVPAWSRKHASRVVRRPKSHLADSGMAAALLGTDAEALASPTSTVAGPLLESFVANELARHTGGSADVRVHHLRDYAGHEADIVLERSDGALAAVEVKATGSPGENHLKHLRWLRDQLDLTAPGTYRVGMLLHTGPYCHRVGDRLWLAPINALWGTHNHQTPQPR